MYSHLLKQPQILGNFAAKCSERQFYSRAPDYACKLEPCKLETWGDLAELGEITLLPALLYQCRFKRNFALYVWWLTPQLCMVDVQSAFKKAKGMIEF